MDVSDRPLICTDHVSWSLIRCLFWWVRSSAGCPSQSAFVPVSSKMSRLFSAVFASVCAVFEEICRSGSSRRSCWTTNRLQQKCDEIKMRCLCPTAQSRAAQVCSGRSHTWKQLRAVDVHGQVVVSVRRGKRNSGAAHWHRSGRGLLLQVESELVLLSIQLEPISAHWELRSCSVTELHPQLVRTLFGDRTDLLQAQPELSWRMKIPTLTTASGRRCPTIFLSFVGSPHHSGSRSLFCSFPMAGWSSGIHHGVSGSLSSHLLQREEGRLSV